MKLKFVYAGIEYSAKTIIEFTNSGQSPFWSETLFHFYPDMDKEHYLQLDDGGRMAYLTGYFSAYESANRAAVAEKLEKYNSYWQLCEPHIIAALEDAFSIDLSDKFDNLICMTSFCPISPRYLDRNTFDNFFMESEKGALGTAIHEIIHFVWFHVWQSVFRDDSAEYETPHLKWILSEMAVEPIMRDPRLGEINPYYKHKACVYPYFYTMQLNSRSALDTLYEMYKSMTISEFMKTAYAFCTEHEQAIRAHIRESENA